MIIMKNHHRGYNPVRAITHTSNSHAPTSIPLARHTFSRHSIVRHQGSTNGYKRPAETLETTTSCVREKKTIVIPTNEQQLNVLPGGK